MKNYVLAFIFGTILIQSTVTAQKKNENFRLHIKKASSLISIDGNINELAWQEAELANDFFMVLPQDTGKAHEISEVRMTYDDKNIYLAARFYSSSTSSYSVESLRRDFSFGKNDNFLIFIDPFNNQTTGFSFGTNAAGAQWDGTMHSGGKIDLNWDSKWISKVKRHADNWVFEMAIPFKSIRYKSGVTEWGINFSRLDLKSSEKSSWTPIPRQFPTASLAYTGTLVWDRPPPEPGANLSLIPYILGAKGSVQNDADFEKKIGGDIKIGLTSSLNLDLTVNPDFSQVEVDRQVTNLDRYELFFPERRQFFLENGDLFANFGYATLRPFFSRRIGLGVPIQAGARVSGNLNEKWRLGLMDIQTSSEEHSGLPNQNFGVLTLQRKVFSRSSIGLMFVNKQSLKYPQDSDEFHDLYSKYNRNIGLEYNLASSNNLWTGKAFVFKSFGPDSSDNGLMQAANIEYKNKYWNWGVQEESIGKSYSAEVGFIPRNDYIKLNGFVGYSFFPKKGKIVSHGPKLSISHFFNTRMKRTDNLNMLQYSLNFLDRSRFNLGLLDEYVELLEPFDPTRSNKAVLEPHTTHHWNALWLNYNSKPQNLFTYSMSSRIGGYYAEGRRTSIASTLGYRIQPFININSNISYNHISLPEPWHTTEFWLIGSKLDITFTNALFFATLFQYNQQNNKFNLNSQFQWRYNPASNLYIVYDSKHLIAPYSGRSWALTLKLTYWYNN